MLPDSSAETISWDQSLTLPVKQKCIIITWHWMTTQNLGVNSQTWQEGSFFSSVLIGSEAHPTSYTVVMGHLKWLEA
jgi:hypothetical protein